MSRSRLSTELALGTSIVAVVAAAVTTLGAWLTEPGVTALGLMVLLTPAVIPAFQRLRRETVVAMAVSVTFAAGLLVDDSMGIAALLALIFAAAASLGHALGARLHGLDDAVESALFGLRARPLETAMPELQSELARSRRYERPLSLMVVRPDSFDELIGDGTAGWLRLTSLLDDAIRETDLLLQTTGRFIIVSPETDAGDLGIVRRRIRDLLGTAGIEASISVASFPEDGSTFDALLQSAQKAAARRLEVDIA